MPASDAVDRDNREYALALAVKSHPADGRTDGVLRTAARYLEWLRQPTPPATLNLRVGEPIPK